MHEHSLVNLFGVYFKNDCDECISGWLNVVNPVQLFNSVQTLKLTGWVNTYKR